MVITQADKFVRIWDYRTKASELNTQLLIRIFLITRDPSISAWHITPTYVGVETHPVLGFSYFMLV
jgi:hypothetical protein